MPLRNFLRSLIVFPANKAEADPATTESLNHYLPVSGIFPAEGSFSAIFPPRSSFLKSWGDEPQNYQFEPSADGVTGCPHLSDSKQSKLRTIPLRKIMVLR